MFKIYGETRGNGKAAQGIHANRFPNLWLQHGGLTPHFTAPVRKLLNTTFG